MKFDGVRLIGVPRKRRNLREQLHGERIVAERPKAPLKTHSRFLPLKRSQSREVSRGAEIKNFAREFGRSNILAPFAANGSYPPKAALRVGFQASDFIH